MALPSLTPREEASLDRAKTSYLHNSADGPLSESTINLLLVSPWSLVQELIARLQTLGLSSDQQLLHI